MKKILVFLMMLSFVVPMVMGVSTTTSLSKTGTAISELSTEYDISSPNTAHLLAANITNYPPSNEGRVVITPTTPMELGSFEKMSWEQYVAAGYMAHVDVFIDKEGDGGGYDEVLIFEGAKSTLSSFCDVTPYPIGALKTFGTDRGEEINDTTYAWLNNNLYPGPCGDTNFENLHKSLSDWKTTYPNAKIEKFEIEVDGWISVYSYSEAYIDDVMINGEIVQDFDNSNEIYVEVDPFTTVLISPSLLNFGSLIVGSINNPGPSVTIDPTGSNTNVSVEVTDVTEFPFETGLKFNGILAEGQVFAINCVESGNMCTYTPEIITTTLDIPSGAVSKPYMGTVVYTITATP
ncbi:MAG: hypothetical protein ABIB47_00855 [Candidatus Woesearchaeota archaeon]